MVLGHEASGIVVELGSGTTTTKRGDHVIFSFVPMCGHFEKCLSAQPYLCIHGQRANAAGTLLGGGIRFKTSKGQLVHHHVGVSGFATFTVAHEASLIVIDPSFPLDKAALFGCAIMTGVGAVVNTAQVRPGSSVVVFGLGGVGLSAIMGAITSGAWPVIAVDIIPSKLEHAQRIGATHTLMADENTLKAIRDLTDGGADYVFEVAGSASVLAQAYAATRVGGTTVSIGLPHPESELKLKAVTLVG